MTPVGGFTLVCNAFFAHYFLSETLTMKDKVGTAAIIVSPPATPPPPFLRTPSNPPPPIPSGRHHRTRVLQPQVEHEL